MKKIISMSLTLALVLSLAACGSTAQPEQSNATVRGCSLNVVTSYGANDGNRGKYVAAVAAYEAATGVTVEDHSSDSNEAWKNAVITDFMTGAEPDVLFYFTNADADPFINAGKVMSIEEIRQVYPDYATNMKESMMAVAGDGNHYAVPSTGFWEGLFVNQKVLDACGIVVPDSDYRWSQFLKDCETIKAAGYIPIACSLLETPHYWFEFAVMNNGNMSNQLEVPALDENGKLVDDAVSRKWVRALEDIKLLYEKGYFPENTLTATDAETVAMFGEGEAAFLVDGSWRVRSLEREYPYYLQNLVVSGVPGKGGRMASQTICGISMGYFITRKAWEDPVKREAAVQFVTYMTSEEVLSTFATTEVTALVDGAAPQEADLNAMQQSAQDYINQITGMVGAVQDTISPEARSELFLDIQKVVTGQMTPKQAIEAAIRLN